MKVELTPHLQERAELRFPQLGLRGIAAEVVTAISEGRISRDPPSVLIKRHPAGNEFAWTPDRRRVYVLGRRRRDHVTVITCLFGSG